MEFSPEHVWKWLESQRQVWDVLLLIDGGERIHVHGTGPVWTGLQLAQSKSHMAAIGFPRYRQKKTLFLLSHPFILNIRTLKFNPKENLLL